MVKFLYLCFAISENFTLIEVNNGKIFPLAHSFLCSQIMLDSSITNNKKKNKVKQVHTLNLIE